MPIAESSALFRFLARVTQDLILFAVHLRKRGDLSSITSGVDMREYADPLAGNRSRISFEAFVEGDVDPGLSLCWWFELSLSDEVWTLSRRVLKDASETQETLHELPSRVFQTPSEFIAQAQDLAGELINFRAIQDIIKAVRNAKREI